MEGHEVHAVLGLFLNDFKEIVGFHFQGGAAFGLGVGEGFVEGKCAYGDCRGFNDLLAEALDVSADGKIHQRVGAGVNGGVEFFHFAFGCVVLTVHADAGADFGGKTFADGHRFQVFVTGVGRDHNGTLFKAFQKFFFGDGFPFQDGSDHFRAFHSFCNAHSSLLLRK